MRLMKVLALTLFCAGSAGLGAKGQAPTQQGARGARIQGSVRDAANGEALANAEVVLSDLASRPVRTVTAGDNGAYLIENVPAGRYFLVARKRGYAASSYGQKTPDGPPTLLTIEAERSYEFSWSTVRTGSIEGRVFDAKGEPVAKALVEVLVRRYSSEGFPFLNPTITPERPQPASVQTDNQGAYRLSGLPPRNYYLRVRTQRQSGETVLRYYPATTVPDRAAPIVLTAGAIAAGIDFHLSDIPQFKITGEIHLPSGTDSVGANPSLTMLLVSRDGAASGSSSSSDPVSNHDPRPGRFELRNVAPGAYDLYIGLPSTPRTQRTTFPFLVGRASVDVVDQHITALMVPIEVGIDLKGQYLLDTAAKATSPNMDGFLALFPPLDGKPAMFAPNATPGTGNVQPDGTFNVPFAHRGRYRFLAAIPSNLYVSAARLGARNILGAPFEIDGDTTGALVIEVSGNGARLEGTVADGENKTVPGARVVLVAKGFFRNDPSANKTTMTDADGRFTIQGIRPGGYDVFAFPWIEENAWLNSEFMAPYSAFGTAMDFSQGQRINQNLKLVPNRQ